MFGKIYIPEGKWRKVGDIYICATAPVKRKWISKDKREWGCHDCDFSEYGSPINCKKFICEDINRKDYTTVAYQIISKEYAQEHKDRRAKWAV